MKFIQNLNYNDVEQCLDYLKNNKFNFHTYFSNTAAAK